VEQEPAQHSQLLNVAIIEAIGDDAAGGPATEP
jgi:hypothetical protein